MSERHEVPGKQHRTEGTGHARTKYDDDRSATPQPMTPGRVGGMRRGGVAPGTLAPGREQLGPPMELTPTGQCAAVLRNALGALAQLREVSYPALDVAARARRVVSPMVLLDARSALSRVERAMTQASLLKMVVISGPVEVQWDRANRERDDVRPKILALLAVQDKLATPAALQAALEAEVNGKTGAEVDAAVAKVAPSGGSLGSPAKVDRVWQAAAHRAANLALAVRPRDPHATTGDGEARPDVDNAGPDRARAWAAEAAAIAPRLGLATVDVRSDDHARTVTDAHAARGVALGSTVYLHPDRVHPGTPEGRRVLAHELVHLAQSQLPASDTDRGSAESEAAELAPQIASGASARPHHHINLRHAAADNHADDLGDYKSELGTTVKAIRRRKGKPVDMAVRRKELQAMLSIETDPKARAKLVREYEAVEAVAAERGIAVPADPEEAKVPVGADGIRWWAPTTPEGQRAFIERKITELKSYKAGRARAFGLFYSPTIGLADEHVRLADAQLALLDADADVFRQELRHQTIRVAHMMLDDSSRAIDAVLKSYGIAGGSARMKWAALALIKDPDSLETQVDEWVVLSKADGALTDKKSTGERISLATWSAALVAQQLGIQQLRKELNDHRRKAQAGRAEHPGPRRERTVLDGPRFDDGKPRPVLGRGGRDLRDAMLPPPTAEEMVQGLGARLAAAEQEYKVTWTQAEREHPVLAAYRTSGRGMDADQLAELSKGGDSTPRSVVAAVLPKLSNILRTKAAIESGEVDPATLNPVLQLTKQRMFVPPGSYRAGVITDVVEEARDTGFAHWALEAISFALNLIMFIPGIGPAAGALAAAADIGVMLYQVGEEYAHYQFATAASDTNLDKVRSLSDEEPALTGLAWRLVSVGLDVAELTSVIRLAARVRKLTIANTVDNALVNTLNTAGEANGLGRIGDDVVADARTELSAAAREEHAVANGHPTSATATAAHARSATMERAAEQLRNGKSTIEAYTTGPLPKGDLWTYLADPKNWDPERAALHERLLDRAEAHARAFADAMDGPAALHATRGNTAVGKSRAIKGNIPELEHAMSETDGLLHRSVNPDNFKVDLMAADADLHLTSTQVHMESSVLAHRLQERLRTLKRTDGKLGSILIDKRLGPLSDVQELAKMAKETGRKLHVHDVDAPLEVSLYGVLLRKPGGGDPIPDFDTIGKGFVAARKNRKPVIDLFKEDPSLGTYELFATTAAGQKRKVAEVSDGVLKVSDKAAYDELLLNPVEAVTAIEHSKVTVETIDAVTAALPAEFAADVRAVLAEARAEGLTWREAADKHAAKRR